MCTPAFRGLRPEVKVCTLIRFDLAFPQLLSAARAGTSRAGPAAMASVYSVDTKEDAEAAKPCDKPLSSLTKAEAKRWLQALGETQLIEECHKRGIDTTTHETRGNMMRKIRNQVEKNKKPEKEKDVSSARASSSQRSAATPSSVTGHSARMSSAAPSTASARTAKRSSPEKEEGMGSWQDAAASSHQK